MCLESSSGSVFTLKTTLCHNAALSFHSVVSKQVSVELPECFGVVVKVNVNVSLHDMEVQV